MVVKTNKLDICEMIVKTDKFGELLVGIPYHSAPFPTGEWLGIKRANSKEIKMEDKIENEEETITEDEVGPLDSIFDEVSPYEDDADADKDEDKDEEEPAF